MIISRHYNVGDELGHDIFSLKGRLLIPKGTVITERIYQQILKWEEIGMLTSKTAEDSDESTDEEQPSQVGVSVSVRRPTSDSQASEPGATIPVEKPPSGKIDSISESGDKSQEVLYEKFLSLKKSKQEEKLFQESIETVRDVFMDIRQGNGFQEEPVRKMTSDIVDTVVKDEKVSLRLSRLWDLDDHILHHSVDVCLLSTMIGINLGVSGDDLRRLATGAILHDVGKIYIPKSVLNKQGPLTERETELLKKHPVFGVKYFQDKESMLSKEEYFCILHHHEKCSGNGYPQGLQYAQIHLFARIVAVADVYSMATSNFGHHDKVDQLHAVDILAKEMTDYLDKHIVHVFVDRMRDLMLNTKVRLNTGEEGYVVKFYIDSPLLPTILLTDDKDGRKVVSPYLVHLRERPDMFIKQVLREKMT
ncbi:HD domain-containing protein [Heliobacillus mobilis]|uniref:HD domain-containing protein n=1 Tax=Heliobacterium mobile TaxID=28064 RepID=A0A6I3SJP8_HELMO|nr:HD domain-containing phosphohydrolase [Heliobacterium mobile]MTV49036.1 HD domain-containing protein [Heliobacterium mobile]